MIIKSCNTVFVHVPKTAGQSMENALLKHLGKDRTTAGAAFLLRKNEDPAIGPPRLAHLTAMQYVSCGHLTPEVYADSFSFGFVRDPWARTVSLYRYSGLASLIDFTTFVNEYLEVLIRDRHWFYRPQTDFLFDKDDKQAVSFIGRLENVQSDWKYCCQQMGLPVLPLRKDNATKPSALLSPKSLKWLAIYPRLLGQISIKTTGQKYYKDYYSANTQVVVSQLYQRDCRLLNYNF